ncbi:MAG: carboxypeptidase regulatory-like domain-containing protein [Acidobacteriota bacterium]
METTMAQVTTATLSGIVQDPSGAVLPGADVTLTNEGTGAVSKKVSNETGEFVFTFVPIGIYTLQIEMPGFKTFESQGMEIRAAQNIRRRFSLSLGEVSETVTVSGQATLVNTASPEQRESFSSLEVRELPLARRTVSELLEIGTGITEAGGRIRLNGLGMAGTKFTVDGTEASANPEAPGLSMYQSVGVIHGMSIEAIEEVQTIKGVIPAEYGHSLAGNVNLISRSGTNDWHGSLFYNYQGASFNARRPFLSRPDVKVTNPNMVWNQFGGSLGGPVVQDRAFFFFNYEGYRETNFNIEQGDVPTQEFRDMMLDALPFEETRIFLDALPLPNQPTEADALLGRWRGPRSRGAHDDQYIFKGDARIMEASNLAVTYTRGRPFRDDPRVSEVNRRSWQGRQDRVTASYVTGAARWTSETRFGFNFNDFSRVDGFWDFIDPDGEEVLGTRRVPTISFPGMQGLGSELNDLGKAPSYSAEQKFAYIRGRHSFKFGGIWARRGGGRLNIENPNFRFNDLDQLLSNTPNRITVTLGMNDNRTHSWDLGFFVHDDWRVNSKLVLNLGVRWDLFSKFVAEPTDPNAPAFLWNLDGLRDYDTWTFGPVRDPLDPIKSDFVNVGPRLGFAYNPDGQGKNVIRGGVSVMFTPIPWGSFNNAVGTSVTMPFRIRYSGQEAEELGLKWPIYNGDIISLLQGRTEVNVNDVFDPDMDAPYAYNTYFGIQRELGGDLMLETAYVGTRGVKFILEREFNQPDRLTGIRPNPELKEGTYFDNSEQTYYHSWQTSLRKRFSQGLLFNVHYTWGKALGYDGGDIAASFSGDSTGSIQDPLCVRCDKGRSTGDVDHYFAGNWIYDVPFFSNAGSLLENVLGGWQLGGIFRANSGSAFHIEQRGTWTNQRVDVDFDDAINESCCSFGNLQFLNPEAFTEVPVHEVSDEAIRPGNMGAHSLLRPGFWAVDLSLGKNFQIPWMTAEGANLQFRVDMMNATNHVNYSGFESNPDSSRFGRITSTGAARQIQFNARISF